MPVYLVMGCNELHRDIRLIHRFTGIDAKQRSENIVRTLKTHYPRRHFWSEIERV